MENREESNDKRMRKLGLTNAYQNDSHTQTVFWCLLSLLLLPIDEVSSLLDHQSLSKTLMQYLLR